MNKMLDEKQCTMLWHVDDLKSSHVDPKVNDDFHKWLQEEYGQIKEINRAVQRAARQHLELFSEMRLGHERGEAQRQGQHHIDRTCTQNRHQRDPEQNVRESHHRIDAAHQHGIEFFEKSR